jgi:GntR family transcriptional regulator
MDDPLYRQISLALRRQIEAGELRAGDRLPTEDELIDLHKASRNTVRAAIKELVSLNLIETRHGKGSFVVEQIKPIVTTLTLDPETSHGGGEGIVYIAEVARSGRHADTGNLRVGIETARGTIADSLRIPDGSNVIARSEWRYIDGRPWSRQTSFYPWPLSQRAPALLGAQSIEEGTVAHLRELGIRQAGYQDGIEVRMPDPDEAKFFGLPDDGRVQVFEIFRVAYDQHGDPFRLTVTVYRADRNRFLINVGDVPTNRNLNSDVK